MKDTLSGPSQPAAPITTVPLIVIADANVFFSPRLRDIFMHLHEKDMIRIAWTKAIEDEWVRNVIDKQRADPVEMAQCAAGMRNAVKDWEIEGYGQHEARFSIVDAKDRHVAAAAYQLSVEYWPGGASGACDKKPR